MTLNLTKKVRQNSYLPLSIMQEDFNNVFNSFFSDMQSFPSINSLRNFPSLDISESDKMITVKAELPSINEKDITINIHKNRLFISGEKKSEIDKDKKTYHIREIAYGNFSRSISLPFNIDSNHVKASFTDGILTIKVEKPEEEKNGSQTIPITKG